MSAIEEGRKDLAAWLEAQPDNFYTASTALQALVARDWPAARQEAQVPVLERFGAVAAGPLDAAVAENNLGRNLPVLDPYDGLGRPVRPVRHHPSYDEAGRLIYGSGIMAAYGQSPTPHQLILGLFFLSGHVGEGGHNCPLACTAGAIRALQRVASPEQRARHLPPLLDPRWDHNHSGAQFLTEVQGGSDVGANATRAEPGPGGRWRIWGEKWFCSNVDADVYLMTARPVGAPEGTRGLGLFLVPARRADGAANGLRIRRLKDKLGTRTMASGELDFEGAEAEALGPVEHGFRAVMEEVINTSRLYNAFGCAAHASRAYAVASGYARHRRAFGGPIAQYSLVQESLATLAADADGCLAASWWLAGLLERLDSGQASAAEQAFYRVALNVNKLRTAQLAHGAVLGAIELLGGNGAIESFSPLPRLLRDNVVYENWEGTHNVLRAQVLRDCRRLGLHEGFFAVLRGRLDAALVDPIAQALDQTLHLPDAQATLRMRPLVDRMAALVMLGGLEGLDAPVLRARATLLRARHVLNTDPGILAEPGYIRLVSECLEWMS